MQYFFTDEAGDLGFKRGPNISKYFIACSCFMDDPSIGDALMALRRDLVWRGRAPDKPLHATEDRQDVRDEVFDLIQTYDFRIDATILEKSKAEPKLTNDKIRFVKTAWYYHFKHVCPNRLRQGQKVQVGVSGWGTKRLKAAFNDAINDVMQQTLRSGPFAVSFWPNGTDPCLQIADYCTWAIQRKWERNDSRSYDSIKDKIESEFDLWRTGSVHYY